ncbi:MAG TPA: TetR/AcrR family transcriptional regulator, partial [Dehalococcoidia bacterium]|nr:TetR/AcrR family transcriptional regulator [Dehalococcoidia bacterium]
RRVARRDVILDAARRVFARRSVFAASITEIAQEADYSKAAIYFYFRNKEEIFLSLVLHGQDTYHDLLARRLAGREDRPALENLRLVWDCLLELAVRQPDFFTLAAALPAADFRPAAPPEVVEAVDRRGRDIFALIRRVIEWGIVRGEIPPDLAPGPAAPAIYAAFIGGILHSQTQQKFADRAVRPDPLLEALFQLVAHGLVAGRQMMGHQPPIAGDRAQTVPG